MTKLLQAGKWLFVCSFSFWVLLHLFLPTVGVEKYVPKYLPFPYFINYFTGICMLAFLVSCMVGKYDKISRYLTGCLFIMGNRLIHLPKAADPVELLNVFRITNMIGASFMYALAFAKD